MDISKEKERPKIFAISDISELDIYLGKNMTVSRIDQTLTPVSEEQICVVKNLTVDAVLKMKENVFYLNLALLLKNPEGATLMFQDILDLSNMSGEVYQMFLTAMSIFIEGEPIIAKRLNKIFIKKESVTKEIDEIVFLKIQEVLETIYIKRNGVKAEFGSPADAKAAEIAARLEASKEKIAKQKKEGETSLTFTGVIKILIAHTNFSIEEIKQLPYVATYMIIEQLMKYDSYQVSIKAQLAGAKDIKIKHWLSD